MNTKYWLGSIVAVLMTSPITFGQVTTPTNPNLPATTTHTQNDNRMTTGAVDRSNVDHNVADRQACKASELVGLTVKTVKDEEKGKIKDLMISPDGRIVYAAVSFGGFLGIGDKLFAVPFDAIHVVKNNNKIEFARIDVTEESIKNRQGFDQDHWPTQADQGFLTGTPRNAERPVGATER